LVRERKFRNVAELRAAEQADGDCLSLTAGPEFIGVLDRYERRMRRVRALPTVVRQALLASVFPAVGTFQSRVFLPLRAKLLRRNIDSPRWLRRLW
jgi:hypothetical protein